MHTTAAKRALLVLRVVLGWLFIYAGYTKIINPDWSAAGYLENAATFPELFQWLAQAQNIEWVNLLNEWGLLLIGLALLVGLFTRAAAIGGIVIMILYYIPILEFPYVGDHSYLVDDHIVYIAALLVLYTADAGRYIGLDKRRR